MFLAYIIHFSQNMQQESESEDDGLEIDVGDDDAEEEPEHEAEVAVPAEQEVSKAAPAPLLVKDTERQLSKKELKKKGLAELDAVLAELGISSNDKNSTLKEGNGKSYIINEWCVDSQPTAILVPLLEGLICLRILLFRVNCTLFLLQCFSCSDRVPFLFEKLCHGR